MKVAAHILAGLCSLALPTLTLAQQANDSTAVIQSVIGALRSEGVKRLALRIHENNPLDQHLLKAMLDSTTVAARPGRVLICAWPADNPPAGSGYDIDIKSLELAADSAVLQVISICDSGAANGHAPFTVMETFTLKKSATGWAVAKRDMM